MDISQRFSERDLNNKENLQRKKHFLFTVYALRKNILKYVCASHYNAANENTSCIIFVSNVSLGNKRIN